MEQIITDAENFVKTVFDKDLPSDYTFHNYDHTAHVRDNALEIARLESVSSSDTRILELASLFHDLGNIHGRTAHELKSCEIAEAWLREKEFSEEEILQIRNLILSTNMEVEPRSKLEQIIKDADLAHLGNIDFESISEKLRQEIENIRGSKMTDTEWLANNVDFFHKHSYFTNAGNNLFAEQKQNNLKVIKDMLEKNTVDNETAVSADPNTDQTEKKKKKKKKKKALSDIPEKGIETMFRVSLRNHVQLSRLADNKANIMLSINAVVISVVLTSLVPKLDTNEFLQWPTFILLTVCIISIIFATLSTIPNITTGTANRNEISEKKVNLLFFGNFHNMELDDYTWGMNYMMTDREYLYNSLIKDLYFLGKVLHKKYKFLRITYAVFLVGIISATISFVVALMSIR
ncbi:MAG: HD domain-containing protein [Bacteroidia bacterium]|nr:HD domain-containing protein [Bacteroidia bacterium]